MRTIIATAGYRHHTVEGPPEWIVADVHGGRCVLLFREHPDETLECLLDEAARIRASRKSMESRKRT